MLQVGVVLAAVGAYPPLVVLTTIVTGNHFFLDAIAGVAVLALGFAAAWRLETRRAQQDDGPRHACLT
jgi:membrane-associated phospholipid phosphatase